MKIYTRSGDKGQTSLWRGDRVAKCHERVEAYGDVDELNSCLGIALSTGGDAELLAWIREVQRDCFTVGSWLATVDASEKIGESKDPVSGKDVSGEADLGLNAAKVEKMEQQIDRWEKELPPLKNFILPGGSPLGAQLHLARAMCRRAERSCVRLIEKGNEVPVIVVQYLNRLSDALFVAGRYANHSAGVAEEIWT